MDQEPDYQGKKVFLLYPHSVIRDEMLDTLIMTGYETYTLSDEKRALKLLAKFPGSIMFINIDEGLKEKQWEAYVRGILADESTKDSRLGIMSYNQDKYLMEKYLIKIAIPCGYIHLKLGLKESTKIIMSALEANEARGRRKYIRADCSGDINSTINYKEATGVYRGNILDISSVGVAVRFDRLAALPGNSLLKGVQIKLWGGIVMLDMILMGQRHDDKYVYILLFCPNQNENDKIVIHRYIKHCLQKYIDDLKI